MITRGTTQVARLATGNLAQRRSIQISATALADKGAGDIARDAAQRVQEGAHNLKEGAQNYAERAKAGAYNAAEKVKDKAHDLKEKIVGSDTADQLHDAKENVRNAKDNVKGAVRDKADDAKDAAKRYAHQFGKKDPNERIQR